jgi:uncharacterized phiE125 gp8 family phage protein
VTLAQAKDWLRVDSSDEDSLITTLIEAARQRVEEITRRALITQQFEFSLDQFPTGGRVISGAFQSNSRLVVQSRGGFDCGREILLPKPPLVSVQSLKYYDQDGTLQTLDSAAYHVDAAAKPGRIVLADNYDWPEVSIRPNAVVIAYTAGYGDAPGEIPQALRVAIKFMLAHWYSTRTPINVGSIMSQVPETAEALLWQYRIPEFY